MSVTAEHLSGHSLAADPLFRACGNNPEERHQRSGLQGCSLGQLQRLGVLHKLRRAMVRPGRDPLAGVVEVERGYWAEKKPAQRAANRLKTAS